MHNQPLYHAFCAQIPSLPAHKGWVVGLSGGMDSILTLELAYTYAKAHRPFSLMAIHIMHGLHPDAHQWQTFCKRICQERSIPFLSQSLTHFDQEAGNLEARARKARWAHFKTHTPSNHLLLLGHHLDDQIETLFQRQLRGSGLVGLSAMQCLSAQGSLKIWRPLLLTERTELVHTAETLGLQWINDSSNQDEKFERNWFRNTLLPSFAKRFPNYRKKLSQHIQATWQDLNAYDAFCDQALKGLFQLHCFRNSIHLPALLLYTYAQRAAILRRFLHLHNCLPPSTKKLHTFLDQCTQCQHTHDASPSLVNADYILVLQLGVIALMPKEIVDSSQPLAPPEPGKTLCQQTQTISTKHCTLSLSKKGLAFVQAHSAEGSLKVWHASSLISPAFPHTNAHTSNKPGKPLKALYQELKIPKWARHCIAHLYWHPTKGAPVLIGIGGSKLHPKYFTNAHYREIALLHLDPSKEPFWNFGWNDRFSENPLGNA